MRNPYHPGRPVDTGNLFCGRSRELRTARSLLANVQCISLVGPRRIGKTSFLRQIADVASLANYTPDSSRFVFTFINCAELNDLSRSRILQLLLERARAGVRKAGFICDAGEPLADGMTFVDFSSELALISETGAKLIFLFDEFEYFAQNRSLDPALFAGLRSIASSLNIAHVTASNSSLLDLTYANSSVLGSPFFNIFTTVRLGPFEDADARDLISTPARSAGMVFSEPTVQQILALADHHPFFIQVACFQAFELQAQQGTLAGSDYQLLQARVEDELRDHFRSTWAHLKHSERRLLAKVGEGQTITADQEAVETLKNQCLIKDAGGRWILPSGPWHDFVTTHASQARVNARYDSDQIHVSAMPHNGSAETCTVALQITSEKRLTAEVEGSASFVSSEPGTWDTDDTAIDLLKLAVQQLFLKPQQDWRSEARCIGEKLYDTMINTQPEMRRAFVFGLGQLRPQDLHIRFRVPREFLSLPLELMHDGKDWLAMKHPVAKFVTGEQITRPLLAGKLRNGEELRALLVASTVSGEISLNGRRFSLSYLHEVENEIEEVVATLQAAADRLGVYLRPRILVGEDATCQELRRELRKGAYDLFHFCGHAAPGGAQLDGGALFLRESMDCSLPKAITAGELKSLMENSDLRFAYFNCCEGVAQVTGDVLGYTDFLGIVDAAVQAGLPAVLGMRWPVSDLSACLLACAFYEALFPNGEIDSALLRARQSLRRDDMTWISPVLVMQS